MKSTRISISKGKIAAFCRRNHIRKLALFGSVLRDGFCPESDVDVLVEFKTDHSPGFIGLYQIESELSSLLGNRKLDLVTEKFLSPRIRQIILEEAQVQYAEG